MGVAWGGAYATRSPGSPRYALAPYVTKSPPQLHSHRVREGFRAGLQSRLRQGWLAETPCGELVARPNPSLIAPLPPALLAVAGLLPNRSGFHARVTEVCFLYYSCTEELRLLSWRSVHGSVCYCHFRSRERSVSGLVPTREVHSRKDGQV